jgi:predicted lysophospholipase L1 biosynthesis ABC-type transport system permease subunit
MTVSASIHHLQTDPTLLGLTDSRGVGGDLDVAGTALAIVSADPRVDYIEHDAVVFGAHMVDDPGQEIDILAFEVLQGQLPVKLPAGRLPAQRDEVALGPALLDRLGLHVGDDLVLSTGGEDARYRIVGSALVPEGDFRFDDAAVMTFAGSDRLIGSTGDNAQLNHQITFDYESGVDKPAADADLRTKGIDVHRFDQGVLPGSVANLGEVADLPLWLALYLALIGLTALGHALVIGVSADRYDFDVLRALGLLRRSTVSVVMIWGLSLAAIAALVGFPVGMFASRELWGRLAQNAHVVAETTVPWAQLIGAAAVGFLAIVLIGGVTAVRALHHDATQGLRTG